MKELKKYMTVGLTDDNTCGVQVSPDMDAATALQLIGTLSIHILNAFYAISEHQLQQQANQQPDQLQLDQQDQQLTKSELDAALLGIKESMYDAADAVFSNVLTQFYPDAPKSDITDEAIIELTNKKIEDRYNALSEKEKKQYKANYAKQKLRMQFSAHADKELNKDGKANQRKTTSE